MRLMFDLQLLAYQADLTRVVSFMWDARSAARPTMPSASPTPHQPPRTPTGAYRRRPTRLPDATTRCRMTSTVMDAMDVPMEQVGRSTGKLDMPSLS